LAAIRKVAGKVALAKASLLDDAVASRRYASLVARKVKTRAPSVTARTILTSWYGEVMTLEAIAPFGVVSVHNTTNSRKGWRRSRKTLERQGSDGADVENDLRWIANLGVRGEE
jgi:hypothetical protein